jgi:response regulator RpfG family c-di-GMP phosphodiesterase
MDERPKPIILCVDDETRVLDGLALVLRRDFDVRVASSPEQGLQMLRSLPDLAVVVSDMRMPKMDGADFLHQVMLRRPDATRIILTGYADREDAVRAVNQGQVFRFLSKPCNLDQLRSAIEAGVVQHRLMHAERAVLQETLLGCIDAMMEVLALVNPVAFGRAGHIKRRAMELAARLGATGYWQLEAAAMLSQLGYAALPPALVDKIYRAENLTPEEQARVDAVPDVANRLLEHIPRLEPVIQILTALKWNDSQVAALGEGTVGLGARILGLILEYDALSARGLTHDHVYELLRARTVRYGPKLLSQLQAGIASDDELEQTQELPLRQVRPGMVLLQEIRTSTGALLVPKGFEVTKTFLDRIANIAPELLESRVHVNDRAATTSARTLAH